MRVWERLTNRYQYMYAMSKATTVRRFGFDEMLMDDIQRCYVLGLHCISSAIVFNEFHRILCRSE